jgi:hypothetical protein
LEAATSRLEDLAVANTENFKEAHAAHRTSAASLSKDTSPAFNTGVFTPEQARTSMVEEPTAPEEKSPVIVDYEKLVAEHVDPWVAKSGKIEPVVGEQVPSLSLGRVLIVGPSGTTSISSATCVPNYRPESPTTRVSTGIPYPLTVAYPGVS